MPTALVTGCAGFIGSHLSERLLADGYRVIGLDNFDPFYDRAIKRANLTTSLQDLNFVFHEVDLRAGPAALAAVLSSEAIDVVVHLAAKAGVGPSVQEPAAYLETNVLGTVHLMEWMCLAGVKNLFFASSSSVYGNTRVLPFREDMSLLTACISPYAASKLSAEQLTFTYHHLHGFNVLNARFFTVYGPRQRPDLAIHKFARLLLAGKPIPMYGDGSTARDYTFVADTVDGVVRGVAYLLAHPGTYQTLNLGNSSPVTLRDLIAAVGHAVGVTPILDPMPMQAGDVEITYADIRKAHELIGYVPQTSLPEGLQQFVRWLHESETGLVKAAAVSVPIGQSVAHQF